MSGTIKNYNLGHLGVNVDKSELELDDAELREAQNASRDPLGIDGAITKRPGLLPITPDMGNAVLGGIGVPFALKVSTINGTTLSGDPGPGGAPGGTPPVGGTPPPGDSGGSGTPADGGGGTGVPGDMIRWYRREASDGTIATSGLAQGFWETSTGFASAATETQRGTNPSFDPFFNPTKTLHSTRTKNLSIDGVNYTPGENFATGTNEFIHIGAPNNVAVLDNVIYFVPESASANAATTYIGESLCSDTPGGDGQKLLVTLNPSESAGFNYSFPYNTVIMSLLAANGKIYFSTGNKSFYTEGAVYQYDPVTGKTLFVGATSFGASEMPYALCWHAGRLWTGTWHRLSGLPGKVYWIRPDDPLSTGWTLDHTMIGGQGILTMGSYQGKLYVGSHTDNATNNSLEVRDTLGVWTVSDTTAAGGVTHGAFGLITFGSNLYYAVTLLGGGGATLIRKFNGTSWSTVATPSIFLTISWIQNSLLFFGGGGNAFGAGVVSTPDGTVWTDKSSSLTNTTGLGLSGGGVAVYQKFS